MLIALLLSLNPESKLVELFVSGMGPGTKISNPFIQRQLLKFFSLI